VGGLERRTSIFDSVPKASRLVVDTGSLVVSDREQDLIKYRILFEAFGLLSYDAVHLTSQDMEAAGNLGVLTDGDKAFGVVTASGQDAGVSRSFHKQLTAGKSAITVNVAAFDAGTGQIDRVAGLFPDGDKTRTINVLILEGCEGRVPGDILSAVPPVVDCVAYPSDADEPRLLSQPGDRPLVFTVGRFGRHIGRINVTIPSGKEHLTLQFADVPVAENLPKDEKLVALYRSYQQLVRDSNLLEKFPRGPLPGDATYAGSKTCAKCHGYEYGKWSTQAHAGAFATLQKVGSDRDPECVICHTVGMEYAGGFVTQEQTPHLQDVGCEACHGPGFEHGETASKVKTGEPRLQCLKCHTPEHSGEYASHKEEYMKKIVHWREP
jgi:hypothetical protein